MAEKAFVFTNNGTGDGTSGGYTALEWSELWRKLFLGGNEATQGVLKGVDNELAVSGTASPLAVNTGAAVVYGKLYTNSASVNLTVTTPAVGTTGGHVILRLDWVAQTVRLVAVRNTDGVNSTPSLTQNTSTYWEIRLATFTITTGGVITLTDARAYAHFAGMVATANIDNLAVTTAKLAADSVDTTKAGSGIPQLTARRGGSSTVWQTAGSTNYTPAATVMQVGAVSQTSASSSGTTTVTLPQTLSQKGLAWCSCDFDDVNCHAYFSSTSQLTILWKTLSGGSLATVNFYWMAIGPE